MTNTKSVASKAFVAIVAAAMVFSLVAPAAKAATAEELQVQIAALMAQIEALKGGSMTPAPVGGNCAAIPAPLTMNATGANVTALQNFLINSGQSIPAGATGFFGGQTKAALAAWQSANGVAPAAGYYGPVTAAAMAAKCVPTPTTPTEPTTPGTSTTLKGEASLDAFDVDDADDTDVEEGDEEAEIGMITVNFADGDAEISRLDLALTKSGAKPWDAFESVQIMVDGEMVAEADASAKSDYLGNESLGVIRFSNLKLVAMEDEEMEITVTATMQGNLDAAELGSWNLKAASMRFFDADGVASTEAGALVTGDTATFNIDMAGENEELKFSLSSNNPDASDIIVDETSSTNNVTVLEYKIKAEDNDIDLNNLFVKLTTSDLIGDVVGDIEIEVDGQTFKDESTLQAGSISSTTATYNFDIDGDVTVDADEEVTVKVIVDFKRQDTNYANGTTIKAEVTDVEVGLTDAEGADDLSNTSPDQLKGTALGKTHTLVASGITLDVNSTSANATINNTTANDSFGEFKINFDVTAVEETAFVALTAARGTSTTAGASYIIEDANGVEVATGTVTQSLSRKSGGSVSAGYVEIGSGDTATFELVVTFNPVAAGQYRVQMVDAGFAATAVTATGRASAIPADDYETSNTLITS